jgi:hypothetical protein
VNGVVTCLGVLVVLVASVACVTCISSLYSLCASVLFGVPALV